MFIADRIRELIEKGGVTQLKFSEETKVKKTSLYAYLSGTSKPGADTLEIIADYFKVPIDYFFDRQIPIDNHIGHTVSGTGNKVVGDIALNECQLEVEHLKVLLEEKERIITEKERTIQILINK